MKLGVWKALCNIISVPFNIISILNSLEFINIGIYGTYSLAIGLALVTISWILPSYLKQEEL